MTIRNLLPTSWPAPLLLPPLDHCNRHPCDPDHARHDPIGDFTVAGVLAEAQTQATVDDTQGDKSPTESNVRNCPDTGLAMTDVCCVVELAKDGLDGEEDDDDDTDDRVVRVDLVGSSLVHFSWVWDHILCS